MSCLPFEVWRKRPTKLDQIRKALAAPCDTWSQDQTVTFLIPRPLVESPGYDCALELLWQMRAHPFDADLASGCRRLDEIYAESDEVGFLFKVAA